VRALKLLFPILTINTRAAETNAQPPAAASVVATVKSTVTAVAVTLIPVPGLPVAGGSLGFVISGSISSEEHEVKKATPNMDITANEPDFFKKSLLASERDPDLMLVVVFIITYTVK
jgi:hypothetical protein